MWKPILLRCYQFFFRSQKDIFENGKQYTHIFIFRLLYSWRKLITSWKAVGQPSDGWHFSLLNSDKQTIYRNCEADASTVLRGTPSSSEVAIDAARFPVATEIATMRWKPIQSEESTLYWYYWFTIERMEECFLWSLMHWQICISIRIWTSRCIRTEVFKRNGFGSFTCRTLRNRWWCGVRVGTGI